MDFHAQHFYRNTIKKTKKKEMISQAKVGSMRNSNKQFKLLMRPLNVIALLELR
jgi:hypothetical protein